MEWGNVVKKTTARKGGDCEGITLEGRPTSRQSFWAVLANFVLRMWINCYLPG